jgi:hypothetical protein
MEVLFMIKKLGGVSLILMLMMCLTGFTSCNFDRSPTTNDHEIWICEEPFAYFIWSEEDVRFAGEIFLGERLYEHTIRFGFGSTAELSALEEGVAPGDRTRLLTGPCKFSKNKVVMEVYKGWHGGYNDDYDKLIFERHEFDPEKDEKPKPGANGK